jgi:hypothetical protein
MLYYQGTNREWVETEWMYYTVYIKNVTSEAGFFAFILIRRYNKYYIRLFFETGCEKRVADIDKKSARRYDLFNQEVTSYYTS